MMNQVNVPFASSPWMPGVHPLERKKTTPGSSLALLEFAPGFADPQLCRNGHAGYVLEGALTFELDGGPQTIRAGEGFELPPGTRHRALNLGSQAVRLFLVTFPHSA